MIILGIVGVANADFCDGCNSCGFQSDDAKPGIMPKNLLG